MAGVTDVSLIVSDVLQSESEPVIFSHLVYFYPRVLGRLVACYHSLKLKKSTKILCSVVNLCLHYFRQNNNHVHRSRDSTRF